MVGKAWMWWRWQVRCEPGEVQSTFPMRTHLAYGLLLSACQVLSQTGSRRCGAGGSRVAGGRGRGGQA
eukprot:6174805-Pleurochrysis_carterae.AAC.1